MMRYRRTTMIVLSQSHISSLERGARQRKGYLRVRGHVISSTEGLSIAE